MHDVIIDDTRTSLAATIDSNKRNNKPRKKRSFSAYLIDWVEKAMIIACLISIDFLLFAGAGSYNMFSSSTFLTLEVWYILGGIFALSVVALYIVSFSSFFQNVFVSFIMAMFVIVMLNQFAAFDKNSMLASLASTYISHEVGLLMNDISHIVLAVIVGVISFFFVTFASKKMIAWVVLFLFIIIGAVTLLQFNNDDKAQKFRVVKEDIINIGKKPEKRFIFIGLPTVGSYNYINDIANDLQKSQSEYASLRKTLDIMLGFYAKNNFTLYPHAYVNELDANNNWAQILNANSNKSSLEYLQRNISINSFWKFNYLAPKNVFLKESKLFDTFKKAKFGINVYGSGGVELCKIDNNLVVNRCVEKNSLPIDFDGMNLDIKNKILVLLAQWFESTKLFDNFAYFYSLLRPFIDVEKLPMVGISYNNIDVKNSLDVLDKLIENVEKDTGNRAYFVNLNLPGDTFIYDEFCKVKPIEKWQNKTDLPWVKKISDKDKRMAYAEQLRCVFGALEKFLDRLEKSEVGKESVVVIQGTSGINGMAPINDKNFVSSLKNTKYVDMAIKDPLKGDFKVNYSICSAPNILKQYLYRRNTCPELKEFNLHVDAAKDLAKSLHNLQISDDLTLKAKDNFEIWFSEWQKAQNIGKMGVKTALPEVKSATDLLKKAPVAEKVSETVVKEAKIMEAQIEDKPEIVVESLPIKVKNPANDENINKEKVANDNIPLESLSKAK